jgi:uncharacterized protein YndB with AHSA1/START domain
MMATVTTEPQTAPRLLVVTHGDPNAKGVWELFLRELASHYPAGRLVRYTLVDSPNHERLGKWLGFPSVTRRVEHSARPVLSSWSQFKFCQGSAPRIADEITRIVRDERIDLIWIVLNSPNNICVADHLTRSGTVPLVAAVFDDPEYLAYTHYFDPWTKRSLLRSFASVLRGARRVAVASDGMAELYGLKYNVHGTALIHGIHPSLWKSGTPRTFGKESYVVGFAGSLVCKREWNAFIAALSDWNRIEPSRISVRFIGRFPRFGARSAQFVEMVGSLSLRETVSELAETDVAYVPYWFDRRHSWAAKTAFPNKISAYVAAGVPVMYHGPRDSTPSAFLRRYQVGLSCHSLQAAEIQGTLRRLLFDQDVRATVAKEQSRTLAEQLGTEAMLRRFAAFLGIEPSQLLPIGTWSAVTD